MAARSAVTTSRSFERFSSPASGAIPRRCGGRRKSSACRLSITGGRPRPGGRSRPTVSASSACQSVPGSSTRAVPGWDVRVLDAGGEELLSGEIGALVVKLPMPPGSSPTLWNADARFREIYLSAFPGYYQTADAGYVDDEGYLFVMSRTDDIINVAGHRLSTGAIEEVLAAHPAVAEAAVIGAADDLKGQLPIGFLVLKAGVGSTARRNRRRGREACKGPNRPCRLVQGRRRRRPSTEDQVGQDPARDDAPHRRR